MVVLLFQLPPKNASKKGLAHLNSSTVKNSVLTQGNLRFFHRLPPKNPPVVPKFHALNHFVFRLFCGVSAISVSSSWTKEATNQFECGTLGNSKNGSQRKSVLAGNEEGGEKKKKMT